MNLKTLSLGDSENSDLKIILCYPRFVNCQFSSRLQEIETLQVKSFILEGNKKIGNIQVLGKGHASLVVKTISTEGCIYALKIRRVDSGKPDMFHEVRILTKANNIGIGAKIYSFTKNFILLSFIEGLTLSEWITSPDVSSNVNKIKEIFNEILRQCRLLDASGLDHGELSRADKHIIINQDNKPVIIDFEKSSDSRRVSNVTSICQYLFVKGRLASKVEMAVGKIDKNMLLNNLREYKQNPSDENFAKICLTLNLKTC